MKQKSKVSSKAQPSAATGISLFVAEMDQMRRAQEAADALVKKREAELANARHELARAQADTFIANPDADQDSTNCEETQAFVTANLAVERAKATSTGVRRRIAEHDGEILKMTARLEAERASFNINAIAAFESSVFGPARQAFAAVLRQADALADALTETIPGASALPAPGNWKEDLDALALNEANLELRDVAVSLHTYRVDAERRARGQEMQARLLARSPFNPEGSYKVRKPFTAFSKSYALGETVDAREIPLGMLGKLHTAGCLTTVSTEEF